MPELPHTDLIPGVYTFRYSVSGGNGCSPSTQSDVEIVVSSPIATSDPGPDQTNVCFGTPVQMDAVPPISENLIGTWTVDTAPAGDTVIFEDINDPKTLVSGLNTTGETYILTWTISNPDDDFCPSPASNNVTITTGTTQGPQLAAAGPDECFPNGTTSFNLNGNEPAVDEIGEWTVLPNNGGITFVDSSLYNTVANITANDSYILTWTLSKNTPGCQSTSDDIEITVGGNATADAGPDQSACASIFTMAATSSTNDGVWSLLSGPAGFTVDDETSPTAQFTFEFSGQYIFQWAVNNGTCTLDTDEVTLEVGIPSTTATVGADQDVCNASSVTLSGNTFDSNTENGFWTLLSGAPNTPSFSDVNDPGTSVAGLVTGSYTFRWTIVGSLSCPSTFDDIVVDVFAPADAGRDQQLCEASNTLLEATFGSTGTWVQIDGPGVNGNAGTPATISQNPANSNVAEVTMVPGNSYVFEFTTDYSPTCTDMSDTVIVNTSAGPSIAPNAGLDQTVCIADNTSITLEANNPLDDTSPADGSPDFDTTQPGNSAFWRFASVPSGSVATFDDSSLYDTTLDNLTVPGIYILEWNFSTDNCTDAADVLRIEVFEAPSSAVVGADQTNACQLDARLEAVSPAIGIGEWSITTDPSGGDIVIDSPNAALSTLSNITTLGTYVFTWTVTNGTTFASGGCAPSVSTPYSITFTDVPPSNADAGDDQLFCDANQTNLDATPLATGNGTWSQTAGPGVSDAQTPANITAPNNPSSLVLDLVPGTYEFTWTSTNGGCTLTDTMEIIIQSQPLTAEAGADRSLAEFDTVVLDATAPSEGTGVWSQVSGPSTANFIDETDPSTSVTGTSVGTYVFQWTVSNGICTDVLDTVEIEIVGRADLELTKTINPNSANAGDNVTFRIRIFNNDGNGQSDADGISVRDIVPNGYSVVLGTVSNDGVYNPGNFNIVWSNLSVANGATLDLTFEAIINESGSYLNTAEIIAANQFDPDSSVDNSIASEDDQDDASVTIRSADLSLVKTVLPATASVGDAVTFTLRLENSGTSDATGVSVSDVLPAGYALGSINDGGASSGSGIEWSGLSVTASGSTSVSFTATVNAPTGTTGEYLNTAEITASDQADPDSTPGNDDGDQSEDDESSASVALESVDLELAKTLSPGAGNVGDLVAVTVNVSNNDAVATGDATGVTIVERLPGGFDIVGGSISNGGVYNPGNLTIVWSGISVASGTDLDLDYSVTVNANGNYTSISEVTTSDLPDLDSTPGNGIATEDDYETAAFIIETADLSLVKDIGTSSSDTPNVGDTVVFELTVTNTGPDVATNVRVEDLVPRGYTLNTINNGGTDIAGTFLTWNIASVPVGNTVVSYAVTVNAPSGDVNEYLNTTEIAASDQRDPDSEPFNDNGDQSEDDEDFYEVTPQVIDLELDISVNDDNPNVGDVLTYSITLSNTGSVVANGIDVQNIVPVGFGNISSISNGGTASANAVDWAGLSVPVGTNTLVLTFNAQVLSPTGTTDEYRHIAQVTDADQFDSDSTPNNDNGDQSEDEESAVAITIQEADLEIIKTANSEAPNVGETVVFTLTITNTSTDVATGVSVSDVLPSGFSLTAVGNGGTRTGNTATWSGLSVLGNGGRVLLTYEATVNAPIGVAGEYTNNAQITASDQYDPDSDPLTGIAVDEDGDGNGDDDDEASLNLSPAIGDLSLTKIVVDNNVSPNVGSEISFEITVFNDGPNNAANVEVADLLPTGFDFVVYSTTSGIYNENTGIWRVGDIRSGDSETLVIDVLVNPSGDYDNVAEVVASDVFDPDSTPGNDLSTEDDQDNVVIAPVDYIDVSLTKTVDNDSPDVGDTITFTLSVDNRGPSNATNIEVLDVLPNGFTYVSDTSGSAYDELTGIWEIADIAANASVTMEIEVTVNPNGNYVNMAQVVSHTEVDQDSSPNNNVLAEDDQVEVVVTPRAIVDLSVTKIASTMTPDIGSTIVFTVSVSNDGPSDATQVVVTDLLETGYSFVSAAPSTGTYEPLNGSWTIGHLPDTITETITITANVLASGDYANTAELTDLAEFDVDSEPANNDATEDDQVTINPMPVQVSDLTLVKSVDNTTPRVGENVEFTIDLTNNGPNDTRGVVVSDLLPTGYTYISHNATSGSYDEDTGIWNLNRVIFDNTTETLNITTAVNPTGNYTNVAEVIASDNNDPTSTPDNGILAEDDQDDQNTVPIPVADLSISKTVDNEFPDVSDDVTFTLTVTNDGPSAATGIEVTDILESGYTFISDDSAGSYNSTTGIWTIPDLASEAVVTLNMVAAINTTGTYGNTAEITGVNEIDPDSEPNNNVVSEDDQASQSTFPRVITDISVQKTVDNLNPSVGAQIVFTVAVTNDGPSDATGVIIEDIIASGYDFLNAATSAGTYVEDIGSWDVGNLSNGATETLVITVEVLPNGTYTNIAELIALNTFDPDSSPDNNLGSEDDQDTVTPRPTGLADLSLTKEVSNLTPNVGDTVEFTVNVSNSGDSNATGVVVTDRLPSGYTYVSHIATIGIYDEITGIWQTNGTIPNGTTETLLVLATINVPSGENDEYLNLAQITASDQADPDSDPNSDIAVDDYADGLADDDEASIAVVPQVTDIGIAKTVDNTGPRIGENVTFIITASNESNALATNIGVQEQLPTGYRLVSAVVSNGVYDETNGFWTIASLDAQTSETLEIIAEVLEPDDYLNIASLAFVDQIDSNEANDSAQVGVVPGCLHVFNEFSPNGDGVNEVFVIDCISRYPGNTLKVYNRWGNIVFEQNAYDNTWGGISNGRATINEKKKLPVGTYYYILDLGDGSQPIQDWLYINE